MSQERQCDTIQGSSVMVLAGPCLHASLSNFFLLYCHFQHIQSREVEIIWWLLSPFIKNFVVLVNYSILCAKSLQSYPTVQPHGLQPASLLCPWDSPGKNTGVGCHALFKGTFHPRDQMIFPTQRSNLGLPHCRQILCQLIHKGSQRTLEWVANPFSSGSSWPRNRTEVSCIAGGFLPTMVKVGILYQLSYQGSPREVHNYPKTLRLSKLTVSMLDVLTKQRDGCAYQRESNTLAQPKCSFWFFHTILWKNPNKLFGQSNTRGFSAGN